MSEKIIERLSVLQGECEAGQKMMADRDTRRAALTSTLLRIEGAIEVLKKLTGGSGASHGVATAPTLAALG